MPNNRILFIVEGEVDEVTFLKQLYTQLNPKQKYEVYSYRTNIHILAQALCREYPDFETAEVDVQLVLSAMEKDEEKRKILRDRYRDVYLIFDFEPQHDCPHFDIIRRMLGYFADSTDHGKLYINYPMMQSYKDLESLPDDGFADRQVLVDDVKEYKKRVSETSGVQDYTKYRYHTFISIAVHHVKKANRVLTTRYLMPDIEEYFGWNGQEIFDKQVESANKDRIVWVLNTSMFLIIDYSPNRFFQLVQKKKAELDI